MTFHLFCCRGAALELRLASQRRASFPAVLRAHKPRRRVGWSVASGCQTLSSDRQCEWDETQGGWKTRRADETPGIQRVIGWVWGSLGGALTIKLCCSSTHIRRLVRRIRPDLQPLGFKLEEGSWQRNVSPVPKWEDVLVVDWWRTCDGEPQLPVDQRLKSESTVRLCLHFIFKP